MSARVPFLFALSVWGCGADPAEKDAGSTGASDTSTDDTDTGAGSDTGEQPPEPVNATAILLDPIRARGVEGLQVGGGLDGTSCTTDSDGACTLTVPGSSSFALDITGDSILPHLLQGDAGSEAFETISFVASPTLTDQVYGLLGVARDDAAGTVVVGLDRPDLSPAYGASAAIDGEADLVFVLAGTMPAEGNTLPNGGSSIVTFVNVPPGTVTVTPTGPDGGTCGVAPSEASSTFDVQVEAGVIAVVAFVCR
jgi:hypothetical protein